MKKTYCDLCQSEMDDWNDMFTLSYENNRTGVEIIGMISARSRLTHNKGSIFGYTDTPIDICKDCFIQTLSKGEIKRIIPPVA